MIIVEGPDGGGKSSLAHQLHVAVGWKIAPRVVSNKTTPMTDLGKWTEDNVRKGWHNIIYDRHRLYSEPIYGPLMGREQRDPFDDIGWLETQYTRLDASNPIVIFCIPPKEVVLKNVHEGVDDNSAVHDIIGQVYDQYVFRASVEAARRKAWIYDYTVGEALFNTVLRRVQRRIHKEKYS